MTIYNSHLNLKQHISYILYREEWGWGVGFISRRGEFIGGGGLLLSANFLGGRLLEGVFIHVWASIGVYTVILKLRYQFIWPSTEISSACLLKQHFYW